MGEKEVILNINRRRFKCKKCRKTFNEELDFVGARRKYTHRYTENIIKQLINSDVSNVAKNNGLSDEEVYSMLEDIVKNILPINVSNLKRLGIDEISLVKGQVKEGRSTKADGRRFPTLKSGGFNKRSHSLICLHK